MQSYDPKPNAKVHLVLVAMLITLAIMCAASMGHCGDELPFQLTCTSLSEHPQENRACGVFYKALEKHELLRTFEQTTDPGFLWYLATVGASEGVNLNTTVFMSFTMLLCLPQLDGVCMSVWHQGIVTTPGELSKEVPKQVHNSLSIYASWLDLAAPVFRRLLLGCQERPPGRSVANDS